MGMGMGMRGEGQGIGERRRFMCDIARRYPVLVAWTLCVSLGSN